MECDAQPVSLCCRTLIKTQDYLDVFARFKQKENIEAVERMLTSKTELELFERSQLGSCLLPSLPPLLEYDNLLLAQTKLNLRTPRESLL